MDRPRSSRGPAPSALRSCPEPCACWRAPAISSGGSAATGSSSSPLRRSLLTTWRWTSSSWSSGSRASGRCWIGWGGSQTRAAAPARTAGGTSATRTLRGGARPARAAKEVALPRRKRSGPPRPGGSRRKPHRRTRARTTSRCSRSRAPAREGVGPPASGGKPAQAASPDEGPYDEQVFEKLRALRTELARETRVPPYVVFHDATLRELARALPRDEKSLLLVKGAGPSRWQR